MCVFCAGQGHAGLCEGPADNALLVPSPALSGSDLRLRSACPGSLQRPRDTPPQQALVAIQPTGAAGKDGLGGLGVSPGFEAQEQCWFSGQEHNQDCALGRRSFWTSWMRRLFLAECSKKCLVLGLWGSSHQACVLLAQRAGCTQHFNGSHPPKTLARCCSPVLSFMVTEFSLESSWGEGIGIVTAFLIKLQSVETLWVQNPCVPWLHCGIWRYKAALKSTK